MVNPHRNMDAKKDDDIEAINSEIPDMDMDNKHSSSRAWLSRLNAWWKGL